MTEHNSRTRTDGHFKRVPSAAIRASVSSAPFSAARVYFDDIRFCNKQRELAFSVLQAGHCQCTRNCELKQFQPNYRYISLSLHSQILSIKRPAGEKHVCSACSSACLPAFQSPKLISSSNEFLSRLIVVRGGDIPAGFSDIAAPECGILSPLSLSLDY